MHHIYIFCAAASIFVVVTLCYLCLRSIYFFDVYRNADVLHCISIGANHIDVPRLFSLLISDFYEEKKNEKRKKHQNFFHSYASFVHRKIFLLIRSAAHAIQSPFIMELVRTHTYAYNDTQFKSEPQRHRRVIHMLKQ